METVALPSFIFKPFSGLKGSLSKWKYLSFAQRVSLGYLLVLLVSLPLLITTMAGGAIYFRSRAYSPPATPPTPPNPSPTPVPSTLVNGSFENDVDNNNLPDGWDVLNTGPNDGRSLYPEAPDGLYVVKFTPSRVGFKTIYQQKNVSGSIGDVWNFKLWTKTELRDPRGRMRVRMTFRNPISRTSQTVSYDLQKTNIGTYQSGTLTAPQAYKQVVFFFQSSISQGEVFLDDVVLYK